VVSKQHQNDISIDVPRPATTCRLELSDHQRVSTIYVERGVRVGSDSDMSYFDIFQKIRNQILFVRPSPENSPMHSRAF